MPPVVFLLLIVGITLLVWAVNQIVVSRRQAAMRRLAAEWKMSYVPQDLFNLAGRIAASFPIPGAADLCVLDLIYGVQGDRHRYVFTAEYTLGVAASHRRAYRAMTVCEPRDPGGSCMSLAAAPEDLPLLAQYIHLRAQETKVPTTRASGPQS